MDQIEVERAIENLEDRVDTCFLAQVEVTLAIKNLTERVAALEHRIVFH